MSILTSYYSHLLGQAYCPAWNFSLSDLYPNPLPQLRSLDEPFLEQEITDAVLEMNKAASLGPDGFGPGFYIAFWPQPRWPFKIYSRAFITYKETQPP